MLSRIALAGAIAIVAIGFGLAHAGTAGADTYTVCGYGTVVPISGGGTCMTLPDAIAAAQASSGADTINMLPGDYCPIDLEGSFYSPIKFVGVGLAGEDTSGGPIVFDGPEASLTTFVYNEAFCGTETAAVVEVNGFVNNGSPFTFQNLTIDGSGGEGIGLYSPAGEANLTLRDAIVENVTGYPHVGLEFQAGYLGGGQYSSLEIDNSAILNNYNGVYSSSGNVSVYDSTIAGNIGSGISVLNYEFSSFSGDTIAHNTVGVVPTACGCDLQVVDTIVANNLQNCSTIGDWEFPASDSWNNLLESENEGCEKFDTTDTVLPSITMPSVALNGGPTPSIMTPGDAAGHGASPCGLNGVDQREAVVSGTSCDVGSVQESADVTPDVAANDVDLGTVSVGTSTGGTSFVSNTGGGLVGVSGVSISGAGWSITSDGCTYAVMEKAYDSGCSVGVSVHPTGSGTWNGTLTIHTTAGDLTAHLHALTPNTTPPPSITSFTPDSGGIHATVTITGTNLTGATQVKLNGTAVAYSVTSATKLTFTVPVGATDGTIAVTTAGGTTTSSGSFTVSPPPTITSISPGSGSIGTTVTITGTNLGGTVGIEIGSTITVPSSVSATSVTFAIPPGAASGTIKVLTTSGSATSADSFTVTG